MELQELFSWWIREIFTYNAYQTVGDCSKAFCAGWACNYHLGNGWGFQGDAPLSITFPAKDNWNRDVILKGFLWQMGEKTIECKLKSDKHQANEIPSMVLSVTIWKDEADPDFWGRLGDAMVRTVKDHLREAIDLNNVLQVWVGAFGWQREGWFCLGHSAQFFVRYIAAELMDVWNNCQVVMVFTLSLRLTIIFLTLIGWRFG